MNQTYWAASMARAARSGPRRGVPPPPPPAPNRAGRGGRPPAERASPAPGRGGRGGLVLVEQGEPVGPLGLARVVFLPLFVHALGGWLLRVARRYYHNP